ncbi:ribonuclease H-like domain-containing protein [Tanacetum coccineum]
MPRPSNMNIVCSVWLFKHKHFAYGSLSRYKARLVSSENNQQLGVNYDGTFSPVVKPATIPTILNLVASWHWPRIIAFLYKEISMTDLGSLISFTGISINGTMKGMFLFHKKYVVKVLERVVQQVFLYMHDILEPHLAVLKRILCYVCGTLDYDYCVFLGNNLLSWSFKRQYTFSRSTVKAKNCGVANAMHETSWLQKILQELHSPLHFGTVVYCDKVSAVYLSSSPMQHQCTKHIEIDIHFVRDRVATG